MYVSCALCRGCIEIVVHMFFGCGFSVEWANIYGIRFNGEFVQIMQLKGGC
jgi:hypothetical protein